MSGFFLTLDADRWTRTKPAYSQAAARYQSSSRSALLHVATLTETEFMDTGVSFDAEASARESKTFSKHLVNWGDSHDKSTAADIKDVTDRLAWMQYTAGEIQEGYAKVCLSRVSASMSHSFYQSLEQARQALKDVRNYENKLGPSKQSWHCAEFLLTMPVRLQTATSGPTPRRELIN